jgi:hypothetical protein
MAGVAKEVETAVETAVGIAAEAMAEVTMVGMAEAAMTEVAKEVETAVEFLETAMGATELGAVAAFSHLPG